MTIEKGITTAQIKLIQVARRQLGLEDSAYRDILHDQAGVWSCKDLDQGGVEKVLKRFRKMGFKVRTAPSCNERRRRSRKEYLENVSELVTFEQKMKLDHLRHDLQLTMYGYQRLCWRTIGRKRPATVKDGQKMIEAMKAMFSRKCS